MAILGVKGLREEGYRQTTLFIILMKPSAIALCPWSEVSRPPSYCKCSILVDSHRVLQAIWRLIRLLFVCLELEFFSNFYRVAFGVFKPLSELCKGRFDCSNEFDLIICISTGQPSLPCHFYENEPPHPPFLLKMPGFLQTATYAEVCHPSLFVFPE